MIHELRYFAQLHLFLELCKCKSFLLPSKMSNILLNKHDEIIEFDLKKEWFSLLQTMNEEEIIENNNGWIKIESDDDLPKETIKCIVCFFDGKKYIEGSVKYRTPELFYSLKQEGQITHYKQIEKIEPPIF